MGNEDEGGTTPNTGDMTRVTAFPTPVQVVLLIMLGILIFGGGMCTDTYERGYHDGYAQREVEGVSP